MMFEDLSVVIPWRGTNSSRTRIFEWVMARYHRLFPEAELIVVDSQGQDFNRGAARNKGVRESTRDVVLLADADTIAYPEFVAKGLKVLDVAPWVIPYAELQYYNCDQESATRILSMEPDSLVTPKDITWEHKITSWAGQVLVRKADFWAAGGYNERFTGWGYEDNAFKASMDLSLGVHQRVNEGWTIHIWHPAPVEETWQQPAIEHNRKLYEETKK